MSSFLIFATNFKVTKIQIQTSINGIKLLNTSIQVLFLTGFLKMRKMNYSKQETVMPDLFPIV